MKKLIYILFLVAYLSYPQDTVKIMTWNLLNYTTTDTSRNNYYRTVISSVNPDILIVQEMTNQTAVNLFLNKIVNNDSVTYSVAPFIDGFDSDNALYFKTAKFASISNIPIKTELRDINEFKLYHKVSLDTFRIYSAHLKSSTGTDFENQRGREIDSLRKVTNALPNGKIFFVCGDFNFYSSTEPAYQKLLQDNISDDGNFYDAILMTGSFEQTIYAQYHTQSTRARQFGGGATGGLDDRFDFLLYSTSVKNGIRVSYLENSMTAYGNDGNHHNDSINKQPNTAVSVDIANALHYASDHLPVIAKFIFPSQSPLPVELNYFSATISKQNKVNLIWQTATEVNNYGFEIDRASTPLSTLSSTFEGQGTGEKLWENLGFVKGNSNSNSPKTYTFTDNTPPAGKVQYRLKQIDNDGSYKYSDYVEVNVGIPSTTELHQNYPNPFNPSTAIKFSLSKDTRVKIIVYDILGNVVNELVNENKPAGNHIVYWNSNDTKGNKVSSGVYFYELVVGDPSASSGQAIQIKKMNLVK